MGDGRGKEYKLPVALEDIHVVDLKAFKAGFDGVEDVLTGVGGEDLLGGRSPRLGRLTLRERPWRLTYPFVSGSEMNFPSSVLLTGKKSYKTKTLSKRDAKLWTGAAHLGQNNNLISRDLELLKSLPEDDLG